jgi:hypothetical protein
VLGRLIDGRGHWVLAAGIAVCVGALVYAAFGMNHTKTVTKTVTKTKTVKVASQWDGSPEALAAYLKPKAAKRVPCPKGVPPTIGCFVFEAPNFYATLAVSAAS